MITIKCAKCKTKVIKYKKIGMGNVLKCYKDRISQYYQEQKTDDLKCTCGEVLGTNEGNHYKMRQNSFIYTGTKIK